MDDLLREFLSETTDQIANLDGALQQFADDPNDAQLQAQIRQLFHTIKGASGFLALPRLETIAGSAERYLQKLGAGTIAPTSETAAVVSGTIRHIVTLLEAIARSEHEPAGDDGDLLVMLAAATAGRFTTEILPTSPGGVEPTTGAKLPEVWQPNGGRSLALVGDRIDEMTDLVGELVLTRNNLNYLMLNRDDPELEAPVRQLDLITSDLGQRIFETRELTQSGEPKFELIPVVAVECAGSLFALPRTSVVELVAGAFIRDFLTDERQQHPLMHLSALLGRPVMPKKSDITAIIEDQGSYAGIVVERATVTEEMVVRPLPPLLSRVALYRGIGLLGDGRIALLLDPDEIIRAVRATVPPLALTTSG
jgi:chemotaxis protein histidine kinase CheA